MNSSVTEKPVIINKIEAFTDNYIWCIHETNTNSVALVDPGDAKICINYIEDNEVELHAIFVTHRHHDHVGGIKELVEYCEKKKWSINIYGPTKEATEYSTHKVKDGDVINDSNFSYETSVMEIYGHTQGHVGYLINDNLFCGDTLFSGGCGRIFDGTHEQLFESLQRISALPEKTQVYCAHEYTEDNLTFALTVDPENLELINYYNYVKSLRFKNQSTIPTSIHTEKLINPFLRCDKHDIKESVNEYCNKLLTNELSVFTELRNWKNVF